MVLDGVEAHRATRVVAKPLLQLDNLSSHSADGVTTIGIPIALGVIVFTVLITGFYVQRANSRYDAMTREILKETTQ